jgi:hypothetical protein
MTYGVYMRRNFFGFIRARVELLWDSACGPITDCHMATRASVEFKGGKIEVTAALKQLFSTSSFIKSE